MDSPMEALALASDRTSTGLLAALDAAGYMVVPKNDWDIDANLPTYTRDFLRMIKEGKLEYDICTYGTAVH